MNYRPEIDGLRAVAVLSVIFFHAGFEAFAGGFVGVDVFFVISGYLITALILQDLIAGRFSLRDFYLRRARRILPALLLVTLVSIPFVIILFDLQEIKSFGRTVFGVSTFSANIVLWLQAGYFEVSNELKPLLHTWSLAVEEQYYLIFPLVCVCLYRWGLRTICIAVIVALFSSFLLGDWASLNRAGAAFYLLPTRAWEILAGALAAFYLQKCPPDSAETSSDSFLTVVGMGMILFAVFSFDAETAVPGRYILVPIVGTLLIILFARRSGIVGRVLAFRPVAGLGLISYSLYLWHQPTFAIARHQGVIGEPDWRVILLAVTLLPVAYVSWRFVEIPFRKQPAFMGLVRLSVTAPIIVVFGVVGWFGFELYVGAKYGFGHMDVARQFSDPGSYVISRWPKFVLRDFDTGDPRKKVVLIGDSFAQDILNVVEESALASRYQLSTYHIPADCGNIWTDKGIDDLIRKSMRASCREHARFSDPGLQGLLREADEIWLASSWKAWQPTFVGQTIRRLDQEFRARIRVFGTKSFGSGWNFEAYLDAKTADQGKPGARIGSNIAKINAEMLLAAGEHQFVNILELICGSETYCVNATEGGLLISYDGAHLTAAGAKLLGHRLVEENMFK
ncbi:MAG: acyltransferase family protein [Pseudomonadota bacterium]|nr:acyltransferase family protein [Pseudomonadota bacterium]